MKKTVSKVTVVFGLIIAFILCCTVTVFAPHNATVADAKDSVILYDEFDTPAKSDKWFKNDFIESKDNLAICMSGGSYHNSLTYSEYAIHGDCEILFTASGTRRRDDDWFGLQFGHATPYERGPLAKAMIACFCMRNGETETRYMHDKGGELEGWSDITVDSNKNVRKSILDDMFVGKTEVAIEFTATEARESDGRMLYDVEISHWLKDGGTRPAEAQYRFTDVPADGYFGFAAVGPHTFRIYDFTVKEKNEGDEYETVSQVNIAETDKERLVYNTYNKDAAFYACGAKRDAVWVAADEDDGVLEVKDKPNGIAVAKAGIVPDMRSEKQFELSFDVNFENLPADSSFGVGLGLTEKSTSANDGYYVAVVNEGGDVFARLSYCGRALARSETFVPAQKGTVKVIGYSGGNVKIEYGDFAYTFTDVRFAGFPAIATSGETSPEATVDNVRLTVRNVSDNTVSPDSAIDFSGVRTETDESDPEISWSSPYIDSNKWFCGTTVVMPNRFVEGNKKYISFNMGSDTACFGSYDFYSDFIVRFSLTVTQNRANAPEGGRIGLSFGKITHVANTSESKGIYFTKSELGMTLGTVNCTFADGSTAMIPDDGKNYDLWSSEDWENSPVTYKVMVIARGGKVSLYYAPEDADASEMTVCRAQIDAGDTYGAVAVAGLDGVSFRLHDYSVVNIAVRR